jgi:hypothetical protein
MNDKSVDEIYTNIAQGVVDSINELWSKALIDLMIIEGATECNGSYFKNDIAEKAEDFEVADESFDDFEDLHDIMTSEGQNDWNRATFTLYPDGNFDIDFKYDEELATEIDRLENEPDERFD